MTKLTDYVKIAEATEILGVAQNTLRKWSERGDIPMRRNGVNVYRLFKRTDLKKFLQQTAKPVLPNKLSTHGQKTLIMCYNHPRKSHSKICRNNHTEFLAHAP